MKYWKIVSRITEYIMAENKHDAILKWSYFMVRPNWIFPYKGDGHYFIISDDYLYKGGVAAIINEVSEIEYVENVLL